LWHNQLNEDGQRQPPPPVILEQGQSRVVRTHLFYQSGQWGGLSRNAHGGGANNNTAVHGHHPLESCTSHSIYIAQVVLKIWSYSESNIIHLSHTGGAQEKLHLTNINF
jgi:hypothetical protein